MIFINGGDDSSAQSQGNTQDTSVSIPPVEPEYTIRGTDPDKK